jgi:hypothetical protein
MTLGGKLRVLLLNGFAPQLGSSFEVLAAGSISGQFSSLALPSLAVGDQWSITYAADAVTVSVINAPRMGDFNNDGIVDAADYVVWRSGLGTTYTQADYDTWRANFGKNNAASGASGFAASAVPEPPALPISLISGLALLLIPSRRPN